MKSTKERDSRINGSSNDSFSASKERRKPWSFFELMLSPSIQSNKLRIPELFAKAFSDELSDGASVILTVPSGESCEVALLKEDDRLWFCKGWQEFVEYFSIGFAYFLLFVYEGTLKFKVHIFTPTACEIIYTGNARNRQHEEPLYSNQNVEEGSDDDEIVSIEASSAKHNSDVELITLDSDDEPHHLHGHEESISNNNDRVSEGFTGSLAVNDDDNMEQNLDEESIHSSNTKESPPPVVRSQSEGLIQASASVGVSVPKKPFFVTLIKNYNIVNGLFVAMPVGFARDCLNCKSGQIVKLEGSNGNQWPVRCLKTGTAFNLGSGWNVFARENGLKAGDVCVFELTDIQNCVLKVHVRAKSQLGDQHRWLKLLKHKARESWEP